MYISVSTPQYHHSISPSNSSGSQKQKSTFWIRITSIHHRPSIAIAVSISIQRLNDIDNILYTPSRPWVHYYHYHSSQAPSSVWPDHSVQASCFAWVSSRLTRGRTITCSRMDLLSKLPLVSFELTCHGPLFIPSLSPIQEEPLLQLSSRAVIVTAVSPHESVSAYVMSPFPFPFSIVYSRSLDSFIIPSLSYSSYSH